MDVLTFKIENAKYDNREVPTVSILINDRNIIDILKEYELPFATKEGHSDLAGHYMGLAPESLYNELTDKHRESNHYFILECASCGLPGCWPLVISISKEGDMVTWSNFHQPHRGNDSKTSFWDYSKFLAFHFSKGNYETELNKLLK